MKGSLIVVGFFALGCLLGWSGWLPDVVIENDITVYVLYLLMFQVGLSIGSDKKLKDILGSIRPKLLLVPLATIAGTLVFSALVGQQNFETAYQELNLKLCLRSGVYLIVWR